MAVFTITDVRIQQSPVLSSGLGSLVPFEFSSLPFTPERAFTVGEVPVGQERGLHAHRLCHQMLIAVSGNVLVSVNDGEASREFLLGDPASALYIPPLIWSGQKYLERTSRLFVLASHPYSREDYIEDFTEFETEKRSKSPP